MSESTLLYVAVFVFAMMVIGLGLTVWEFRYGQPRREDTQDRQRDSAPQTRSSVDTADAAAR